MGRYRWQSCSHHSDSEWASFGRYRMRMVHGMDHILLHFHKFFLFLTTQSSGQKNENKVPGCVQLWLGHAEVILEPWETDMLWISEVLLFLATYLWVKKKGAICFIRRQWLFYWSQTSWSGTEAQWTNVLHVYVFPMKKLIQHLHLA